MNAPTEAGAAQAAPATNRGRGRGRGGGYAPKGKITTRSAVPKAQGAKIGPNRLLETEWVKDSILKGNCFVLFAGSGQSGDQQWTFHHPIGETSLDLRAWVATPTRDISFLLQRRESEALAAWKRQAELAKRQEVLANYIGRRLENQTEVWNFENAPAIQPTIRSCMSAAKAAGANESEWLTYSDRAVQVAEQSFKEALRTQDIPEDWLRANPKPIHETMGGPLGDHPQKAVPFLNGLSMAAAKDKVIRVAIGLDQTDGTPLPHKEEEEDRFDPQFEGEDSEEEVAKPPTPEKLPAKAGSSKSQTPPKGGKGKGSSTKGT